MSATPHRRTLALALLAALALGRPAPGQTLETAPPGRLQTQADAALDSDTPSAARWVGYSFRRTVGSERRFFSGSWRRTDDGWVAVGRPLQAWVDQGGPFDAVPLAEVRMPRSTPDAGTSVERTLAVLLRLPAGATARAAVERIRLVDVTLPFDPDGRSVLWLGEHESAASQAFLERLYDAAPDDRARRDLVDAVGHHEPGSAVVTFLATVIDTDASDRVAREAVEALARQPGDAALGQLLAVAESDRRRRVRREAIEQLGRAATRDAQTLLARIAGDPQDALARHALEALLEMEHGAGVDAVIEIARSHTDLGTRALAIRELGDSDDPRAHQALFEIVREALR